MFQTVLVESPVQRSCIFNLRYEYLRRDESIGPSPNKLFSDPFDLEPNHLHFLRLDQGAPHAAIRASVVKPELGFTSAPAMATFQDAFLAHTSFVEASMLCFAPNAGRAGFIKLFAHIAALAESADVEYLVTCPRLEQIPLYQSLFGFQPKSGPKSTPGLHHAIQLMAAPLRQRRAFIQYDRRMLDCWSSVLPSLQASFRTAAQQH